MLIIYKLREWQLWRTDTNLDRSQGENTEAINSLRYLDEKNFI